MQVRVAAERVEEALLDRPRVAEDVVDVVREQLLEDRVAPRRRRRLTAPSATLSIASYQPYRVRPFSRTSTIFSPVRYESGVERPVMNG